VPEEPYVSFLSERLTASSTLVCKMRERLESAYHSHFTLAMQTGAFVQLTVLFVAISSRMSVLSSELEEALQLGISACSRLLVIIRPTGTHTTACQQPISELEPLVPSHIDHDDTGQCVSRCEPTDRVGDLGVETTATLDVRVTPSPSRLTNASDNPTAPVSKKATQKPRVKKAKKKFDEIDKIFGFS